MSQPRCSMSSKTPLDATIWRFRTLEIGQSSRTLDRWQQTHRNIATHSAGPRALFVSFV